MMILASSKTVRATDEIWVMRDDAVRHPEELANAVEWYEQKKFYQQIDGGEKTEINLFDLRFSGTWTLWGWHLRRRMLPLLARQLLAISQGGGGEVERDYFEETRAKAIAQMENMESVRLMMRGIKGQVSELLQNTMKAIEFIETAELPKGLAEVLIEELPQVIYAKINEEQQGR